MTRTARALAVTLILSASAAQAQQTAPAIEQSPQPAVPGSAIQGDATQGEDDFRRCSACHGIGEGAANRMGPQLNGIMGEPAATREGFNYSQAMIEMSEEGLAWTPETLHEFLTDPRGFVPGTKMAFIGVKDAETLDNIIAYLASFSPDWQPGTEAPSAGKATEKNAAPAD